ncbi:S8 family serine peptidase [Sodalis sp. RH23]|uniref:S8 family serine peptidase n=1 Tax=unclassified Sodalis (in: enterobacteria) TaxID=2636512 RepID=UPI0039B544EE
MNIELEYYRDYKPDGNLYARCLGGEQHFFIEYSLYDCGEPGKLAAEQSAWGDELVIFKLCSGTLYQLRALVKGEGHGTEELLSDIFSTVYTPEFTSQQRCGITNINNLKGRLNITTNEKQNFRIQFYPCGFEQLQREEDNNVPFFYGLSEIVRFIPCFDEEDIRAKIKILPQFEKLRGLYRVEQNLNNNELLLLAQELEQLDYVEYCSLSGEAKEDASSYDEDSWREEIEPANVTPNLTQHQGYLDNSPWGMSVRAVWARNITGRGVGVRMQDTGVYNTHEDLVTNITVVSNSTGNRTHGTSTAGIIAALNNGFGMTGIAYDCRLFAYAGQLNEFERMIRDALPGEIVTISLSTGNFPLIDDPHRWSLFQLLIQSGGVVVISASNGGLNLFRSGINDFGDSGVILATSSHRATGRRLPFSNFNFHRVVAAWGENVATTGGGNLLNLGSPNRTYRDNYSGTSAAAPQVASVLALIQSYARSVYHIIFNADQLYRIILDTGHREGEIDLIGPRPNAEAAINYVDNLLSQGLLPPPLSPLPPQIPPRYPFWRVGRQYEVGDRVTHLELFYVSTTRHVANIGWQPNLAPTLWRQIQ